MHFAVNRSVDSAERTKEAVEVAEQGAVAEEVNRNVTHISDRRLDRARC
ncbi:hypothetical protein [Rhabdochromatium marinum]|nr:hypothetical protein [Rhabdochromatium marinum]